MRRPRLLQPLFSKAHGELYNKAQDDKLLAKIVIAYDSLWSLLYSPDDIDPLDRTANAQASLDNLGNILETVLGSDVFDVDPKQLTFSEEVLNP